jgi:hypothetical protein
MNRTDQVATPTGHSSTVQNPLTNEALKDFREDLQPPRSSRRFRRLTNNELMAGDKASRDLFWLLDESLEGTDSLPLPPLTAAEITVDLGPAMAEFAEISASLADQDSE